MKWKPALILFLFIFSTIPLKSVIAEDPPIGWGLLDGGKVLHIWNEFDDYYFNTSSGIQFSNHYTEYWSKNVMGLGYYSNGKWHIIYWTDSISGFERNIKTDWQTFVNITLWKDLSFDVYDFRLAIRYNLKVKDSMLTIQPYIKNLGQEIPFEIGFAWRIKDIKVSNDYENDLFYTSWIVDENNSDGEAFYLNQTLNKEYINKIIGFSIIDVLNSQTLEMQWNKKILNRTNLYVKTLTGQHNAPVTIFVNAGTLGVEQEKKTDYLWHDADLIDYYAEGNRSSNTNLQRVHPSQDAWKYSSAGQSFTMLDSNYTLNSCKFYLANTGNPNGTLYANLYAHTGTFGVDSKPTGNPLATSEGLDIDTLTGDFVLYTLNFNASNQYEMNASSYYCIQFKVGSGSDVDDSNYVRFGIDWSGSSPTHPGNWAGFQNNIWYSLDHDAIFYVYGDPVVEAESFERNPTQGISWSSSINRTWSLERQKTLSLKLNSYLNRTWNLERSKSIQILTTWDASGFLEEIGQQFSRIATLAVNWVSSISRRVDFHKIGTIAIDFSFTLPGLLANTIRVWVKALTSGLAVSQATVTLSNPSAGTILWAYYTDAEGYTPQEDLDTGTYYVTVFKDDYQPYSYLFNFSTTTILEVPLRLIEEGVLLNFNIELLIFTVIACALSVYGWQRRDIEGLIAATIAFFTWFASGLWFMWTYIDTEKVHFWYLFEMFALVTLLVAIRNMLNIMGNAGKKSAWDEW